MCSITLMGSFDSEAGHVVTLKSFKITVKLILHTLKKKL